MLVETVAAIKGTPDDVTTRNGRGRRLIRSEHDVGFSLEERIFPAGTSNEFHYGHHVEAAFVTEGEGELLDHRTGARYPLRIGTVFVLDGHEHHEVRATTELRVVCVFKPPIDEQ